MDAETTQQRIAKQVVRFSPSMLVDAIALLSPEQKSWVIATGFGSLLSFDMRSYPSDISCHILNSYEPNPSILRLRDNAWDITEEDVHRILGLPMGDTDMAFIESSDILREWSKSFDQNKIFYKISVSDICRKIAGTQEADDQFKRIFVVLLSNILIEGSNNPYVNLRMVQFTGDLDNCKNYNWCRYLIHCLQENFVVWSLNRDKRFFKGPLAFLIFFSLEHALVREINTPPTTPAFVRWSNDIVSGIRLCDFLSENNETMNDHHTDVLSIKDEEDDEQKYASMVISGVCEDIQREFQNDSDGTPEILICNLKEAIEEYSSKQDSCIENLRWIYEQYPNSDIANKMEKKFRSINERGSYFVLNKIVQEEIKRNMLTTARGISAGEKVKNVHSFMWTYLNSEAQDPNDIFFKWKNVFACKIDLQSLNFGELILTSVIDIWSCVLNVMNSSTDDNVVKRMFCFTNNTIGIINATQKISFEKLNEVFIENMDNVLELHSVRLKDLNMVFFPMLRGNHHYLVSYNLKNPSMDVLDNMKSDRSVQELYGDHIDMLHKHFMMFLKKREYPNLMSYMYLIPERLAMTWQTVFNDVDCGVFVMHHMSTYMGGGVDNWNSHLKNESWEQMVQLNELRQEILCTIFTSQINEKSNLFNELAEKYLESNKG